MTGLSVAPATAADLAMLHPVIERAYRGESARLGWTHEADLIVEGERTDMATLQAIVADPESCLLMACDGETVIGCVHVQNKGGGLAYLGLLCIEPRLQAAGLGRQLVDAAERTARETFGCDTIEMTVIDRRGELLAWYERRGYARTGEVRDFPIAMDPPLFMAVLAKPLA